jgi:hypothetical protein
MVYSFARIGAAVAMMVDDVRVQNRRFWLRLHAKRGKRHEMPCHHNLETYLEARTFAQDTCQLRHLLRKHPASLMFALAVTSWTLIQCANYATANIQLDEVIGLAGEKGALYWKAQGMLEQGWFFALTGKASDAVHKITSGLTEWRSTGSTLLMPFNLSCLARAYAELGKFDDAWRCIGEAMNTIETTQERLWQAEIHRMAGEIALLAPEPDAAKAEAYFRARARGYAWAAGEILGAARGYEDGAAVALPGQAGCGPRASRSDLRLVHRGFRYARSEGGQVPAR